MTDSPAISVQDLRKNYGNVEAVRGIDLDISSGEVFGLLGPNGAGKTTTIEILEGLRPRTSGKVSVLGFDPALETEQVKNRIGVCLDTCHVFAAGYALSPQHEYQATMRAFDRTIGLKRLRAFHLNDSQKPLDSRVDRHAHIGRGCLGLEPFRLLVNDPRFRRHPMILETPKEKTPEGDMDVVNLKVLRSLLRRA